MVSINIQFDKSGKSTFDISGNIDEVVVALVLTTRFDTLFGTAMQTAVDVMNDTDAVNALVEIMSHIE